MSAQPPAPPPRLDRQWFAGHKQRLGYALIAVSLAVVVGAASVGGFLLHRAAELERQTQRTQQLGGLAFQLHDLTSRAETDRGATREIAAARTHVLTAAGATLRLIASHDRDAARRIRGAYGAYVRGSTKAFSGAVAGRPITPAADRGLERKLGRLEKGVDSEVRSQARSARVTNPEARLALIIAAVAAAFLIGLLIWQFETQRRAGRIDRDNARRSEELMRLRGDFVAAVSHELRTPLTSILGYLELIRDDESFERSVDDESYLSIVQRNAERLLRLVSDLLLVSEVEDGTLALEHDAVDFGELATECVEAAKPAAAAKQIRLGLRQGTAGPLSGDSIRLAQMMDNLVSNAIKFTPPGGNVRVTTTTRDGKAVLEVTDSGLGIAPADQPQLYDRFFRTRTASAHATPGTGLGLTITKAIVDAHGGSIEVRSTLGTGTTFVVELPASPAGAHTPLTVAPS